MNVWGKKDTEERQEWFAVWAAKWPKHVIPHKAIPIPMKTWINLHQFHHYNTTRNWSIRYEKFKNNSDKLPWQSTSIMIIRWALCWISLPNSYHQHTKRNHGNAHNSHCCIHKFQRKLQTFLDIFYHFHLKITQVQNLMY